MNEICLSCHCLYFSSIILSFGQCVKPISWNTLYYRQTPPPSDCQTFRRLCTICTLLRYHWNTESTLPTGSSFPVLYSAQWWLLGIPLWSNLVCNYVELKTVAIRVIWKWIQLIMVHNSILIDLAFTLLLFHCPWL